MRVLKDKSGKDDVLVSGSVGDVGLALERAVAFIAEMTDSCGFPYKEFELTLGALWYASKHRAYMFKFRLRWID